MHLRTSQHQISEGKPEMTKHLYTKLSAHGKSRYLGFHEIVIHSFDVLTQLRRKNMNLCTLDKWWQ